MGARNKAKRRLRRQRRLDQTTIVKVFTSDEPPKLEHYGGTIETVSGVEALRLNDEVEYKDGKYHTTKRWLVGKFDERIYGKRN